MKFENLQRFHLLDYLSQPVQLVWIVRLDSAKLPANRSMATYYGTNYVFAAEVLISIKNSSIEQNKRTKNAGKYDARTAYYVHLHMLVIPCWSRCLLDNK